MAALLVAAVVGTGCQAPAPAFLTDADRAALARGAEAWAQAAEAGDPAALGALYVEDAVVLPPNQGVVSGRAAIETHFGAFPPLSNVRLDQIEVEGSGDVAYVRGRYAMTIHVPGASEPTSDQGKYLEIWKKQADGSWMIARDMYSSDLAATGP